MEDVYKWTSRGGNVLTRYWQRWYQETHAVNAMEIYETCNRSKHNKPSEIRKCARILVEDTRFNLFTDAARKDVLAKVEGIMNKFID